jgi:hypothetical protein
MYEKPNKSGRNRSRVAMRSAGFSSIFSELCRCKALIAALLTLCVSLLSIGQANAFDRIFNLHIKNGTTVDQSFILTPVGEDIFPRKDVICYQGDDKGLSGVTLRPGQSHTVLLARVQGHGCDGKGGLFSIQPKSFPNANDVSAFFFNNAGGLALIADLPNNYHGVLSDKSLVDESFTWTMVPIEQRLKQPIDQRLTRPRNPITAHTGEWGPFDSFGTVLADSTLKEGGFVFENVGFFGNYFEGCFGEALFHPQHVQRLADKEGKAYFMVAQSRGHNGNIYLVETHPGVLSSTGRLIPQPEGKTAGKIIWEQVFTGFFNGSLNPLGNWNHPGKMAFIDGILIVTAQNWSEGTPGVDFCTGSTSNPYNTGVSEDAVLFFDVRDPSDPQYWGKMTASELQVPETFEKNGVVDSQTDRMVSVVSLWRTAEGKYAMNVGGRRNGFDAYATWETDAISPNINNWIKRQEHEYTTGEYGDDLESYQATTSSNGVLRNMGYQGVEEVDLSGITISPGISFFTIPSEVDGNKYLEGFGLGDPYPVAVSGSHHATRQGVPLIYDMVQSGGDLPFIRQMYDTRNVLEVPHPDRVVNNLNDSGPGSLREAIGYGGKITFSKDLAGKTLTLTGGPLVVNIYDVEIDATEYFDADSNTFKVLKGGFTISGNKQSRVLHVTRGNVARLTGITIKDGMDKDARLAAGVKSNHSSLGGGGIFNEGALLLSQSTVMGNISVNGGGGIFNSGGMGIDYSTISGNYSGVRTSNIGDASIGGGGGISNVGNLLLIHTTVAGNHDLGLGVGGVLNSGNLTIDNSIIAGNEPSNKGNLSGPYTSMGANIVNLDAGASLINGTPLIVVPDINLMPLDYYGGNTPTMPAIGASSPVIDGALPTVNSVDVFVSQNQGGLTSASGAAKDIGSVEGVVVPFLVEEISTIQSGFASGSINISPEPSTLQGISYLHLGGEVTLTAIPDVQSEFVSWDGSETILNCGTSSTCDITIVEGIEVRAIYKIKPFLSITYQGNGEVSLSPAGDGCDEDSITMCQRFSTGTETILTAVPGSNSIFSHWEGACQDSDTIEVASITMSGDKSCTAVFTRTSYQLTVASFNGVITSDRPDEIDCGDDCEETYQTTDGPQTRILTASIDPGLVFVRWYGDQDCYDEDEGDGDPRRISLTLGDTDADVHCSAASVREGTEFLLTVEKTGAGVGQVSAQATPEVDSSDIDCAFTACAQNYPVNSEIQLTATPERGSLFAGWNGDSDCTDGKVAMTSNITCSAKFTADLLLIDGSNFSGSLRTEFEGMLVNTPVGGDYDYWSVQFPRSSGTANSTDPETFEKRKEPVAGDLETYSRVVWYTGNTTSSPTAGPSPDAEAALSDYLDNGGCFLLSSSEYFAQRGHTSFAENYLGIKSMTDNIGDGTTHNLLTGTGLNSRFNFTKSFRLTNSESMDLSLSDSLVSTTAQGVDVLFRYDDGGDAAVTKATDIYRSTFFGFPFLGLKSGNDRNNVMAGFLNYCGAKDIDDVYGDNHTFENASRKRGIVSLESLKIVPGTEDYFRWISDWDEDTRFDISFTHALGDLTLEVYDSAHTLIASAQSDNDNEGLVITNVEVGESYFVRIYGSNKTANLYTLNISNAVPFDDSDATSFAFVPPEVEEIFIDREALAADIAKAEAEAAAILAASRATAADYDGDGSADLAVRDAARFFFHIKNLNSGDVRSKSFGRNKNDIPVSGDFDGDGIADIAIRRPSNGTWYVLKSSDGKMIVKAWGGVSSDIPVAADYDGDGITDFAIRRVSNKTWYILQSSDGLKKVLRFGVQNGDIPVPADYDGDGKTDIAIRRPSNGTWYIQQSSDNKIRIVRFGIQSADIPVPADYDGDGKADIAVRRASNSNWYIQQSSDNQIRVVRFGLQTTDIPVVADYDGDGKADIAIRRPSNTNWYILHSSDGIVASEKFGLKAEYIPVLTPIMQRMAMAQKGSALSKSANVTLGKEKDESKGLEDNTYNSSPEYLGRKFSEQLLEY